jgi:exopolysaccharide biosynthesis polyprenyl glycosylphosphotransferase
VGRTGSATANIRTPDDVQLGIETATVATAEQSAEHFERLEYTQADLRDSLFRRVLGGADVLAVITAVWLGVAAFGDATLAPAALAIPFVFVVIAKAMGLYDRDEHLLHKTTLDEVPGLFSLSAITALALSLSGDSLVEGSLGQTQVAAVWAMLFLTTVSLRSIARAAARRLTPPERCLLVGDTRTAEYVREKLALSPAVKAELVGSVPANPSGTNGNGNGYHVGNGNGNGHDPANGNGNGNGHRGHESLVRTLKPTLASDRIDRVILALDTGGRDDLLDLIRELKSHGVKVSVLPEASRIAGSAVELDHLHGMTLLGMRRFEITHSSRLIKRGFDALGSSLALLFLSPILLLVAAAIKLDSSGSVFFRQRRVGLRGQEFEMLKFRSMVAEAELLKDDVLHLNEGADGLFKIADDPRVTRVGRWLRRTQLDEMPQLINVLRGEMSLVGPRPLVDEEDRRIQGWYRRRLELRPGMTGHWQILGSSQRIPLAEMVKLDYLYLANWSLWGDIKLLMRTVPFVVSRRGL